MQPDRAASNMRSKEAQGLLYHELATLPKHVSIRVHDNSALAMWALLVGNILIFDPRNLAGSKDGNTCSRVSGSELVDFLLCYLTYLQAAVKTSRSKCASIAQQLLSDGVIRPVRTGEKHTVRFAVAQENTVFNDDPRVYYTLNHGFMDTPLGQTLFWPTQTSTVFGGLIGGSGLVPRRNDTPVATRKGSDFVSLRDMLSVPSYEAHTQQQQQRKQQLKEYTETITTLLTASGLLPKQQTTPVTGFQSIPKDSDRMPLDTGFMHDLARFGRESTGSGAVEQKTANKDERWMIRMSEQNGMRFSGTLEDLTGGEDLSSMVAALNQQVADSSESMSLGQALEALLAHKPNHMGQNTSSQSSTSQTHSQRSAVDPPVLIITDPSDCTLPDPKPEPEGQVPNKIRSRGRSDVNKPPSSVAPGNSHGSVSRFDSESGSEVPVRKSRPESARVWGKNRYGGWFGTDSPNGYEESKVGARTVEDGLVSSNEFLKQRHEKQARQSHGQPIAHPSPSHEHLLDPLRFVRASSSPSITTIHPPPSGHNASAIRAHSKSTSVANTNTASSRDKCSNEMLTLKDILGEKPVTKKDKTERDLRHSTDELSLLDMLSVPPPPTPRRSSTSPSLSTPQKPIKSEHGQSKHKLIGRSIATDNSRFRRSSSLDERVGTWEEWQNQVVSLSDMLQSGGNKNITEKEQKKRSTWSMERLSQAKPSAKPVGPQSRNV